MRSSALCSATPGQNQEHPFPSHLHDSAGDFCSFSCAALLLLGPVTVSVPFTNPAQHQPNKTSSLLPGYQVELLKQCSPECQNQQNGQVWGQRGMKSSGQVQHPWRKRRESGPFLLVQGQLGQLKLYHWTAPRESFSSNRTPTVTLEDCPT